jgi:hypothetical protein
MSRKNVDGEIGGREKRERGGKVEVGIRRRNRKKKGRRSRKRRKSRRCEKEMDTFRILR